LLVVEVLQLDVVVHAAAHLVVLVHALEASLHSGVVLLRAHRSLVVPRVILVFRTRDLAPGAHLLALGRIHIIGLVISLSGVARVLACAIVTQPRVVIVVRLPGDHRRSAAVDRLVLA